MSMGELLTWFLYVAVIEFYVAWEVLAGLMAGSKERA